MSLSSGAHAQWGVGTVAQGPGGGEGSDIWVKGVGESQDTTSESSLVPRKELPLCTETENGEILPPAQAGVDGESVSSSQSPWQDCGDAVSWGNALTRVSFRPRCQPAWLKLCLAVPPPPLALDRQKDALAVLLPCSSKETPETNLSISHPSMAGPALLGGGSAGGHQVRQGAGE